MLYAAEPLLATANSTLFSDYGIQPGKGYSSLEHSILRVRDPEHPDPDPDPNLG